MRLSYPALTALLLVAPAASAQTAFTEFALSDPDLNSSPETDFWISSAAPADVDADGDLDLLVAGYYVVYNESVEDRLTLYRNDGPAGTDSSWTFTPVPVQTGGLTFDQTDLAWGDVDTDGDPDVVVATDGATVLYRNDGGTLVPTSTELPAYYEGSEATMDLRTVSWADADNDGDLDLLLPATATPDEEYAPTLLLRNDGPGAGDAWTFTDTGADLPTGEVTANIVGVWGDSDLDGDLDLLLGNVSAYEDNFLNTYRNDGGTLVPADSGLAFIRYGTADWGDADGDGDLDVLYAGNIDLPDDTGETVVRVLFKDGGTYTPLTVASSAFLPGEEGNPWHDFTNVTWADYDSDGDVDLLVSGTWWEEGIPGRSLVFVNDGAGAFTPVAEPLPAPITGFGGGAFTWFDIDGDNDLDYFVAGAYYVPGGNGLVEARTQLFRNDAVEANAPPTAPGALAATPTPDGAALSWAPASDDGTDGEGLTYNLWVRRAGSDIVSPMSRPGGGRMLPEAGNVSYATVWQLDGLAPGTYTWTVQAVDNAFNGGPFAGGGTFVVGTVAAEPAAVGEVSLSAAAPNPARDAASVTLVLPEARRVTVDVLDALGRRVAVLHDGDLTAGTHVLTLDASALAPGVYVVRATGAGLATSRRLIVAR